MGPIKKTIVAKEEWWRPDANANVTRLRKSPKLSERGCEESANDVGRRVTLNLFLRDIEVQP